jgi:hypothetical protein
MGLDVPLKEVRTMSYTNAPTFDIKSHNGVDKGLKLGGVLVTSTAAGMNMSGTKPSAANSTISAVAGAANVATVTVQIKDGNGNNVTGITPFSVYSSSSADGLTLASAASTGYSVASGGMSTANGTAVTTRISAMSSATGGCVLSLTDTGKQTSYLVLVVDGGAKISTQLTAGSYG